MKTSLPSQVQLIVKGILVLSAFHSIILFSKVNQGYIGALFNSRIIYSTEEVIASQDPFRKIKETADKSNIDHHSIFLATPSISDPRFSFLKVPVDYYFYPVTPTLIEYISMDELEASILLETDPGDIILSVDDLPLEEHNFTEEFYTYYFYYQKQ